MSSMKKEPNEKEYQAAIHENMGVLEKKLVQLTKMKVVIWTKIVKIAPL